MGMGNLIKKQMPGPATPKIVRPGSGSGLPAPLPIGTTLTQTSQPGQLPPIKKWW
jgi:hypothetical protein